MKRAYMVPLRRFIVNLPCASTMTADDAQKALDEFWEMIEKQYGSSHGRISDEDRKKLFYLEKQYSEAQKSDAANN